MHPASPDRPHLENWLRRTRKQLAPSGRLSELSIILSRSQGHPPDHWAAWLRSVLDGDIRLTLDELTLIETHLTPAAKPPDPAETPTLL